MCEINYARLEHKTRLTSHKERKKHRHLEVLDKDRHCLSLTLNQGTLMPLLFLFLVWPLAEIWLLIQVGQEAGALNTLLLIVATAALGLLLVQLEWQRLAMTLRKRLNEGKEPLTPLLETAAVGLAGVLLFIPGFISDFFGVLLLLPFTRKILIRPLKKAQGTTSFHYQETSYREKPDDPSAEQDERLGEGKLLEGEYQRKDDDRP